MVSLATNNYDASHMQSAYHKQNHQSYSPSQSTFGYQGNQHQYGDLAGPTSHQYTNFANNSNNVNWWAKLSQNGSSVVSSQTASINANNAATNYSSPQFYHANQYAAPNFDGLNHQYNNFLKNLQHSKSSGSTSTSPNSSASSNLSLNELSTFNGYNAINSNTNNNLNSNAVISNSFPITPDESNSALDLNVPTRSNASLYGSKSNGNMSSQMNHSLLLANLNDKTTKLVKDQQNMLLSINQGMHRSYFEFRFVSQK